MVLRSVSEAIPNWSRRETAFFMVLRSVSEAIPNRSRQKDGFFYEYLYMSEKSSNFAAILRARVRKQYIRI